jgi:triacylglycerol esterase/lipase EstA (alpha/beta hydrolase family)
MKRKCFTARLFSKKKSDACVDLYYSVANLTAQNAPCSTANCRKSQLHRSAMIKLVVHGQRFGRLDPRTGLTVYRDGLSDLIQIERHGFVWDSEDFSFLSPVGEYSTNAFQRRYRSPGVGIPLVVSSETNPRPFGTPKPTFSATLVMRADSSELDNGESVCRLELYDPMRVDTIDMASTRVAIAKDVSAALAYELRNHRSDIISNFVNPSRYQGDYRLSMIEPYQRGKIPLILVHGLLSDPFTWVEMINELYAVRGFVENFQIWVFEYPTGQQFLASAGQMRGQLKQAVASVDPEGSDPQLSQIVLVGHSMGGLIAKMQVADSGDILWRSIANKPFDQVTMTTEVRDRLRSAFFFTASTNVSRVVFIGTPHNGASTASRLVGRVGAALVSQPQELSEKHRELIERNPGVFSSEVTKRIPTSIDLLKPDTPILNAVSQLPIDHRVRLHSIIGDSHWSLFKGRSDGIVPIDSARETRAITERYVREKHSDLHKYRETIQELVMILNEHLRESQTFR